MVYLMPSGPDPMTASNAATVMAMNRINFPTKSEVVEDSLEEECGPVNKRSKLTAGDNDFDISPSQYNPLDEPSPLGLRLRKSPSLLDLIQKRISQPNASSASSMPIHTPKLRAKKGAKGNAASVDKLKATNFPAMLLRIGSWEFVSRFDGDLVAKCYFAKQKLVWEILQNGLKSKIEIHWPDIMSLKANFPENGPGTLYITLSRAPQFFKEINPQPRKHTLWQTSADITYGQASKYRQHILQCQEGVLNKHYEKLIQCDTHLNLLSQQPSAIESPYFEEGDSFLRNPNGSTVQKADQLDSGKRSPVSALEDVSSPSSSSKFEEQRSVCLTQEHVSPEAISSNLDLLASEGSASQGEDISQAQANWEQLNALGVHKSVSMRDLVNCIDHCVSEKMASGNSQCSKEELDRNLMLENIAKLLFSDTHVATASDEKGLMSRVNSLCCLLQDPTTGPHLEGGAHLKEVVESDEQQPVVGMSRKDSFSDLLLSLPRMASVPKFLFDLSEVEEYQTK